MSALIQINGLHYKIGRFGLVYTKGDFEWFNSSKTKDELLKEWKAQFLSRAKLPHLYTQNPTKEQRQDHRKKVNTAKENHMKKAEPVIESGDWMTTTPFQVEIKR